MKLLLVILSFLNFGSLLQASAQTPEKIFIQDYAQTALQQYQLTLSTVTNKLKPALNELVKNPSQANLDKAKKFWLEAILNHIDAEVYRFYGGPIDGDDGPERLINSWPIDESYIDYVSGILNSGVINKPNDFPVIDVATLVQLNELGGNTNISTGFHAIEFLLWGQDLYPDSAGRRPFTDYIVGSAPNADRRGQYLLVLADILEKSFAKVEKKWTQSYFKNFTDTMSETEALTKVFKGIYKLSGQELAHERMQVPVKTGDQEDEHSCFSDTTHLDHIHDVIGLKKVLMGSKGNNGLVNLISTKDKNQAQDLLKKLNEVELLVSQIPVPFDQAIVSPNGKVAINAAVKSLEELSVLIEKAAGLWNLKLN